MHILIAPNAFKNSLRAEEVADAIAHGLSESKLQCTSTCFPIADGGDGTGSLIIQKCKGKIIEAWVYDPLGNRIKSSFGLIENDRTAVIEMAAGSGLRLLDQDKLNPMISSSIGTGNLIKAALDEGVTKIILGMGGSATVDGGCGILHALGVRFLNEAGDELAPIPENLADLFTIDVSGLDKRMQSCELIILCDAHNKLLGLDGAAAIFGPQKGASPADVHKLEHFLSLFRDLTLLDTGIDINEINYGGTAGGAAAGLYAFLSGALVSGIDYFLLLTGFENELKKCDLLITGEGSLDEQTLLGKAPFGVAVLAKKRDLPVIAVAGKVPIEPHAELRTYFDVLLPINNEPCDLETAISQATENLTRTGFEIGNMLSLLGDKSLA
ncbi:MAG: glycerate kinase [Sphingobacteriales bacterium]|nr:glycerate kinase [Sphingobacteriales bacterium]